jgi:hypothetical protein
MKVYIALDFKVYSEAEISDDLIRDTRSGDTNLEKAKLIAQLCTLNFAQCLDLLDTANTPSGCDSSQLIPKADTGSDVIPGDR